MGSQPSWVNSGCKPQDLTGMVACSLAQGSYRATRESVIVKSFHVLLTTYSYDLILQLASSYVEQLLEA
jgi:hypothetical protein